MILTVVSVFSLDYSDTFVTDLFIVTRFFQYSMILGRIYIRYHFFDTVFAVSVSVSVVSVAKA